MKIGYLLLLSLLMIGKIYANNKTSYFVEEYIYFPHASAEITGQEREKIKNIAHFYNSHVCTVETLSFAGSTSSIGAEGENFELSEKRTSAAVKAVKELLLDASEFDGRVTVIASGEQGVPVVRDHPSQETSSFKETAKVYRARQAANRFVHILLTCAHQRKKIYLL